MADLFGDSDSDLAWDEEAKSILKAELKRHRLTYADLAERFSKLGIPMTEPTLRNKISRGSFSAVFFLQCLAAAGATGIDLEMISYYAYKKLSAGSEERRPTGEHYPPKGKRKC